MGVIAGKRQFGGPPGAYLGSAVSHGSVSVSDPSDVSGTLCIPSSPMMAGLLLWSKIPGNRLQRLVRIPSATDYSVWSDSMGDEK